MEHKETIGIEIERKYIIKLPDLDKIYAQQSHTESKILQIYLPSEQGETRRIRRREYPDRTLYIETTKLRIDGMSSRETERELEREEFDRLASSPLEGTEPIIKTRHTFIYLGQTFEIDIYPQWRSTAIMETELDCRERVVEMPPFIEIIREVTGNKAYSNASMSKSFPKEEGLPHLVRPKKT